jgi:myo-inositol-1(or 4)-monophosphatase
MNAKPNVADLDSLAALLREVARDEIMPRFRHTGASAKADGSLVTDADLAVQKRLLALLDESYPEIPLLGEEMTADRQQQLVGDGNQVFWCLDPLDGTSNYTCGFPGFAISLALIRGGRAQMAVILDPVRDECFTAISGGGAFLNAQRIAPFAPGERLSDCLAMVDCKRLPPERIARLFSADSFRSQWRFDKEFFRTKVK